jgi:hypothetical protein
MRATKPSTPGGCPMIHPLGIPGTQVTVLRGYSFSTQGRPSTRCQSKDPLRAQTHLKMLSTFGKAISRAAEKNFACSVTPATSVEHVSKRKIRCGFVDRTDGTTQLRRISQSHASDGVANWSASYVVDRLEREKQRRVRINLLVDHVTTESAAKNAKTAAW